MSFLAPLLEIQDLDLASDAARERSSALPERGILPKLAERLAAIDSQLAASRAERLAREAEEEELGRAVSQVAKDIEAAEVERYSGKRIDRDEAAAHKESQQKLRERQASFEDQELELLEAIETLEGGLAEQESARAANRAEAEKVEEAIRKVEAEVAVELAGLADRRETFVSQVPSDVLAAYERVRGQERARGRGATSLEDGRCKGCHIKLPSLEKKRMLAEPEDALIQCPQCRRVLVR